MHSKWARRQLSGIVTKWSKFHQITMPKITKLTFSIRGNLRSFCRFLRSFCGLQFVRLRPNNKKWTFLAWATLVESRLAQIVLQGPCTMQNWKKQHAISEDLSVWHVLGICDRVSKCGTNCNGRGYRYTYTWWSLNIGHPTLMIGTLSKDAISTG